MSTIKEATNLHADLIQTLFDGQKAMSDLALKQASVNLQAKMELQEKELALEAVAMLTNVGGKINTVA